MKPLLTFLAVAAAGFAIAAVTATTSGEREAWDASAFWTLSLPAMVVAAGVAGYVSPRQFPLWGVAVVVGLWIREIAASREIGNLWVVGLLFSMVLAVVCDLGSWAGAALRRRHSAA